MSHSLHSLKRLAMGMAVIIVVVVVAYQWASRRGLVPELPDNTNYETLEQRAEEAIEWAGSHGANERYVIFVDYSIPSGTPRMFIYDFQQRKVVGKSRVMHGPGMGSTAQRPVFSNIPGSKCSSLGKFIVTKEHGSNPNMRSFRLQGLSTSNFNAYSRGLLVHGAKWVDCSRYAPCKYIPLNEKACSGCVTVSSSAMTQICQLVEGEEKPLLLWSYC